MVEFCNSCGTSLPKGDLTFRSGKTYTSHDYTCPQCRKVANPDKAPKKSQPEPVEERDLVFKKGEIKSE